MLCKLLQSDNEHGAESKRWLVVSVRASQDIDSASGKLHKGACQHILRAVLTPSSHIGYHVKFYRSATGFPRVYHHTLWRKSRTHIALLRYRWSGHLQMWQRTTLLSVLPWLNSHVLTRF